MKRNLKNALYVILAVISFAACSNVPPRLERWEFVNVPPGDFLMGSDSGNHDEKPVHSVRITKALELGRYEVTQAQWEAVMNDNPSQFRGADRPVDNVLWNDAQKFCSRLKTLKDGYIYRLPTEAEWEYAARAGTNNDEPINLDECAWYNANSGEPNLTNLTTHPVGQKRANLWGLHDMLGNVSEWCADWYLSSYYASSPVSDPHGPTSGEYRVLRGGSWGHGPRNVRIAVRAKDLSAIRCDNFGFRVAREKYLQ